MKKVARKYIPENLLFDKRMLSHNLSSGIVSPQELQEYLASLPDLSNQVDRVDEAENEDQEQGE